MLKKQCAVFPGSFNPIHQGHINIIKRASKLFDKLYVAVSYNIDKNDTIDIDKHYKITKNKIDKLKISNVEVILNKGLTTNLVKSLGCNYIVRSIRSCKDISYEINMAQNNHLFNPNIETIFFVADSKLKDISSTNQKELIRQRKIIKSYDKK